VGRHASAQNARRIDMGEQGDRVWDIIEKVGVCMLTTRCQINPKHFG
jgi:hypothetical protein